MQIGNFKVFVDLVETGSFSKAAKLNCITQSAVSQQLRAMEKQYQVLVVDRGQKQLKLTAEGRFFYEAARRILRAHDELTTGLLEMKRVISGTLSIETIYSIGLHELPEMIRSFTRVYPDVNLRVEYRRATQIYEHVLNNRTDIGMVAFPHKHPQLEVCVFKADRMVAICSPQHAFARRKSVGLADIAHQKFIAFEPDIPTRKAVDAAFKKQKLSVEPVMEFDNVETLKRAVEIDAGVSIVPEVTVQQEVRQGALVQVPIKGVQLQRPLGLVYRKGRVLPPAMKRFIPFVMGGKIFSDGKK